MAASVEEKSIGANDGADRETSGPGTPATAQNGAPPEERRKPKWLKPLLLGACALALLFGIPKAIAYWNYSHSHVSTDDAYVSGDVVNVSPIISGTLDQVLVDEGSRVRKGQIVARLSDAGARAALRQAEANYAAALSRIPAAERSLKYQQLTMSAAVQKAQAGLAAQQAKATGAAQQVALTGGTSRNGIRQAESQVAAAKAQADQFAAQAHAADLSVQGFRQAVKTAAASLANMRQAVGTAERGVQAARAKATAAQAEADRAAREEARYRALYQQDAVAAQVVENMGAQARTAAANAEAAQAEVAAAESRVAQARSAVEQSRSEEEQAGKSVAQAQAQAQASLRAADAARQSIGVARAGLGLAQAGQGAVGVQQANYASTTGQTGEARADLAAAAAGAEQVGMKRSEIETYRAQARQAEAALANARIIVGDTIIYAPNDGTIVKKSANAGASLSPGQSIFLMTRSDSVWVEANFKETQLTDVRAGQPAEVEVDAFPNKVFKGRVRSINEATGAATALLPPDNATGNFTKVVQRVPVRIELIASGGEEDTKLARQGDIRALRQGMSVTATINISNHDSPPGVGPAPPSDTHHPAQTGSGSAAAPGGSSVIQTAGPQTGRPDSAQPQADAPAVTAPAAPARATEGAAISSLPTPSVDRSSRPPAPVPAVPASPSGRSAAGELPPNPPSIGPPSATASPAGPGGTAGAAAGSNR